jgi:hypothetical protein
MPPTAKISRAEASRRAHHAELLLLAAHTLRNYGRPELGDELCLLANRVFSGDLEFAPPGVD